MMKIVLALACLVAVAVAQRRPSIPDSFVAECNVESHQHGEDLFGEGGMAVNYPASKAVEDFKLRRGILPFNVWNLQRFDLGKEYDIQSEDRAMCRERDVSGPMPKPFGWIVNATYRGEDVFHHQAVQLWGLNAGGFDVELGVIQGNENRPIFERRRSHQGEFFIEYVKFTPNGSVPSNAFDVPKECQKEASKPVSLVGLKAPTRPNIAKNFLSQVRVEQHGGGRTLFGEGVWAQDYSKNKGVQLIHLRQEYRIIPITVLQLGRFDTGNFYEVDSEDPGRCRVRTVSGHLPDAFAWLANATYTGVDHYHHLNIDKWSLTLSHGVTLELGVLAPNNDIPFFYREITPDGEFFSEFYDFVGNASIDQEYFNVPSECQTSSPLQAAAPPPPKITEDFTTEVAFDINKEGKTVHGYGMWGQDTTDQKALQHFVFPTENHTDFYEFELLRFDLHKAYKLSSTNRSTCYEEALNGTMAGAFTWVENANYMGRRGEVDIWNLVVGGVNLTLGVMENEHPGPQPREPLPVFFARETKVSKEFMEFRNFFGRAPQSQYFDVPQECQHHA